MSCEVPLTWLQDLDHDAFVVSGVNSLVNFRVLAPADLLDDLIVILRPVIVIATISAYPNLTSKFS